MRCDVCLGTGWKKALDDSVFGAMFCWNKPCTECGGAGIIHCCEGLVEQPEEEKKE